MSLRNQTSLHHRIWEQVAVICERGSCEQGSSQSDEQETGPSNQNTPRDEQAVVVNLDKQREAEISRLTWTVLDGKATIEERRRLAELVNAQHARRDF